MPLPEGYELPPLSDGYFWRIRETPSHYEITYKLVLEIVSRSRVLRRTRTHFYEPLRLRDYEILDEPDRVVQVLDRAARTLINEMNADLAVRSLTGMYTPKKS